jgi:hypothetical protein
MQQTTLHCGMLQGNLQLFRRKSQVQILVTPSPLFL